MNLRSLNVKCCCSSLLQVQHFSSCHQEWNGNFSHRRPQAYIPPTMHGHTFTLSHSSPNHTTGPHPHLGGHPHSQPTILSYPPSGPLVTAAPVAHLLASPGATRPVLQPTYSISHPAGIVHQVTVGINPRLLPSPTLHPQGQFKPLFPPHSYIASPAYGSFPLSPTKINQYPYIWAWLLRYSSYHLRAKWAGRNISLTTNNMVFISEKPWHNHRESKLFFESCRLECNWTSSFKKQNKKNSSNGRDDLAKIKKEVTYEWLNERMNE